MRRLSFWLLALTLSAAGSEAAHWLAYRLVKPDQVHRAHVLQETGHGYLRFAPLAAVFAVALCLLALGMRVSLARRRVSALRSGAAGLALVPVLTFILQEHLERLFAGHMPWGTALEPTFLVGLLLQLPFGFLAYVLVRLLLRGADALGGVLAPPVSAPVLHPARLSVPALAVLAPRLPVLALGHAGRAPPLTP